MQGWVSIHRKIMDTAIYKDSEYVHLWLHLLLKANHKDADILLGGSVISVKRGQLVTGRKALSRETGINESKIQRALKAFEKCHQIEQQTFSKYRLISIANYDSYQEGEQQTNSKRTANEQQVNTNNNVNNENNVNNKGSSVAQLPCTKGDIYYIQQSDIDTWADAYPAVDVFQELRKIYAWLSANPSKLKTLKGCPRFVNNWFSRTQDQGGNKKVNTNKTVTLTQEKDFIELHTDCSWANDL